MTLALLIGLCTALALTAIDLTLNNLRRKKLARKVNRSPLPLAPSSVHGPLKDACVLALHGCALGEQRGLRTPPIPQLPWPKRLSLPKNLCFGPATQWTLALCRSLDQHGLLQARVYQQELAFLARYSASSTSLRRVFNSLRSRHQFIKTHTLALELLSLGIPLGLTFHHNPKYAAKQAAKIVALSHPAPTCQAGAAFVAAWIARATTQRKSALQPRARRALLRALLSDLPIQCELPLLTVADLAGLPFEQVKTRLKAQNPVEDLLRHLVYFILSQKVEWSSQARPQNTLTPELLEKNLHLLDRQRLAALIPLLAALFGAAQVAIPGYNTSTQHQQQLTVITYLAEKIAISSPDPAHPTSEVDANQTSPNRPSL